MRSMLRANDGLGLSSVTHPHPRFGPLSVYEWVAFLGARQNAPCGADPRRKCASGGLIAAWRQSTSLPLFAVFSDIPVCHLGLMPRKSTLKLLIQSYDFTLESLDAK